MDNSGVLIQKVGFYNKYIFCGMYKYKRILQNKTFFSFEYCYNFSSLEERYFLQYVKHIVFNYSLFTFNTEQKVNFGREVIRPQIRNPSDFFIMSAAH